MRLILIIIFLLAFNPLISFSQEIDTLYTGGDTLLAVETSNYADRFSPRKAALYSAVLPGLGQAYNKSYWKIPLVYGGFVGFYLAIDHYHGYYTTFRSDLLSELDDNPLTINTSGYSETQLRRIVEISRRERDYFIILTGVYYLLQIAEAHIEAHLKEFKLNPELRVQVDPQIHYARGVNTGLSIKLRF